MQEAHPSEASLVAAAKAGDEAAFAALCARYRALLERRVRSYVDGPLRRRVSIQDVVQETYLAAYQRVLGFEERGEGAFGAWLSEIAEYKAREALRRHAGSAKRGLGREVSVDPQSPAPAALARGASPSQHSVGAETASALESALAALPPDHRQVLELVQRKHVGLLETARILGRSYEATKKLFARALASLARELASRRARDGHGD